MSNLKLANPAGGRLGPKGEPGKAAEDGEGSAGASLRDSGLLPLLQDMNKLSGGGGRRTRVEGGQLGGEEWTRHGSFVNKPTRGWLHPNDKVMGPGVSYLVRVSAYLPPPPSCTLSSSSAHSRFAGTPCSSPSNICAILSVLRPGAFLLQVSALNLACDSSAFPPLAPNPQFTQCPSTSEAFSKS